MLLHGYKVVELATFIAGPAAAGMMADWGADVVKVEALTGDAIRWVRPEIRPDIPPNFEIDNHGKRAIALDFSKPAGKRIVMDLLKDADVFITSMRQSSLARAGLDYATLSQSHPQLVYASVSGYGAVGPAAELTAFDLTAFWSRSSVASQTWLSDAMPSSIPSGLGDHITGISAALGVMTGLASRAKTGKGRFVDISLLRTGVYVGSYAMSEWTRRGLAIGPSARAGAENSLFYPTADGRWFSYYSHNPVREWPFIVAAAGRPELADDARFQTPEARRANGRALIEALDAGFRTRTLTQIAEILDQSGMAWSPVQTVAEAVQDPLIQAANCFVEVDDGQGGAFEIAGPPVGFPGDEPRRASIVPRIGEHTDELLRELNYDAAAISELKREGIVRQAD